VCAEARIHTIKEYVMGATAGWYDDPQNPQQIRYFDGANWTSQTAPRQSSGYSGSSTTPPAYGQAPSQGWQGQAGQFHTSQPTPQASPSAFGGAQYVPASDTAVTSNKSVVLWILAALVGIVLLTVLGITLSDGDNDSDGAVGLGAIALGIEPDFDCNTLSDAYIELSVADPADEKLVATTDLEVVENNIGTVTIPSGSSENLIYACNATAEWGDGSTSDVRLELTIDSAEHLYAGVFDR
jgi:Protein of unknown function (DUF2510)